MSLAMAGLSLAVTPLVAASFGLPGVAAGQVALGVATGPLFPATMQFLGRWLPPSERPRASTALDTGITVGSLIAVPLSGLMAVRIGWRSVLAAYGVSSLAFSLVWAALAFELPEQCGYCGDVERAHLGYTISRTVLERSLALTSLAIAKVPPHAVAFDCYFWKRRHPPGHSLHHWPLAQSRRPSPLRCSPTPLRCSPNPLRCSLA